MEVLGISTVFMFVSDLPRSREYYASILGKDPAREREGMLASFDLGGISLLLHSDANATWLPAGAKKGVGVALHFRVQDINGHWARLHAAGIDLSEQPTLLHTGIVKFAMKDPDGYEIEFIEPPADGHLALDH